MRSVGDLMHELGFREDSDDETKKAFVRNLIRAAYPNEPKSHFENRREGEQLSFDIDFVCGETPERKSG